MGKLGVFRQKAISRMNRIGFDAFGQVDDLLGIQESLDRTGSYQIGFMGLFHVNGRGFAFSINSGRGDVEFAAGPEDPHGDLTTICDEDFFEHGLPYRREVSFLWLRTTTGAVPTNLRPGKLIAGERLDVRGARAYVSWIVRILSRGHHGHQRGLFPVERVIFNDRTGFVLKKTAGTYFYGALSLG